MTIERPSKQAQSKRFEDTDYSIGKKIFSCPFHVKFGSADAG